MTEPNQNIQHVTLSSQAFLLLCRLFDRCYDGFAKHETMTELVESIAHILLAGVQTLEEQEKKPKTITVPLTLSQAFFLRRLVVELLAHSPEQYENTMVWWQECLSALTVTGGDGNGGNGVTPA
ncbi:hypothetical protein ACAF76_009705 [Brevibacillus sp. TJ4]|uniref:hypothetical protein n=1 Tax=Brevibacillus sp. TJ4 TaxID=3234853 RepID=UPI003BA0E83E